MQSNFSVSLIHLPSECARLLKAFIKKIVLEIKKPFMNFLFVFTIDLPSNINSSAKIFLHISEINNCMRMRIYLSD